MHAHPSFTRHANKAYTQAMSHGTQARAAQTFKQAAMAVLHSNSTTAAFDVRCYSSSAQMAPVPRSFACREVLATLLYWARGRMA
jgi:hypothetical protein